jgi:hypothetical protein
MWQDIRLFSSRTTSGSRVCVGAAKRVRASFVDVADAMAQCNACATGGDRKVPATADSNVSWWRASVATRFARRRHGSALRCRRRRRSGGGGENARPFRFFERVARRPPRLFDFLHGVVDALLRFLVV